MKRTAKWAVVQETITDNLCQVTRKVERFTRSKIPQLLLKSQRFSLQMKARFANNNCRVADGLESVQLGRWCDGGLWQLSRALTSVSAGAGGVVLHLSCGLHALFSWTFHLLSKRVFFQL